MSRLNDATPEDWDKANRNWLKGNTHLCPTQKIGSNEIPECSEGGPLPKHLTALDKQEGGTHYKNYKIQPMEYIQANNLGYAEGNVVKYITRYQDKNGIEDLLKAIHYIDLIIEDLKERK